MNNNAEQTKTIKFLGVLAFVQFGLDFVDLVRFGGGGGGPGSGGGRGRVLGALHHQGVPEDGLEEEHESGIAASGVLK